MIQNIFNFAQKFGFSKNAQDPEDIALRHFRQHNYLRYNQRVQEHLATLELDVTGTSVLEVGAGIGDHTSFFLDRNCRVVTTDARQSNLSVLRNRYPQLEVVDLDLENPTATFNGIFDIVYCYGVLYHLSKPAEALAFLSGQCTDMMLVQTCVSLGHEDEVLYLSEPKQDPSQSVSGYGCRPTRLWVFNQLKKHFKFVYVPTSQPNHEEFPLDWTQATSAHLSRAIFIASRHKLVNELLSEDLPLIQKRH